MTRLRGLALLSVLVLVTALSSWAGVFVSVAIGPPALPVYSQPLCPGPGYIWTPGYWAYGPAGYYWVPGVWAFPPQVGFLWTPGYWAFSAGFYGWHPGYWGPTVGFYGGINYGFGYTGVGYWGGYWRGGSFYYNRAVNNVNITNVHNVYNRTVVNNFNGNRVSYNGGPGGIQARPTSEEMAAARGTHFGATSEQARNEQAARSNRSQFASANHGEQAMNRQTPNGNAANNGREVPRPPQSNQQARGSWNVPRPPQNSYASQQRAAANVPGRRTTSSRHVGMRMFLGPVITRDRRQPLRRGAYSVPLQRNGLRPHSTGRPASTRRLRTARLRQEVAKEAGATKRMT